MAKFLFPTPEILKISQIKMKKEILINVYVTSIINFNIMSISVPKYAKRINGNLINNLKICSMFDWDARSFHM